ncbi:MAG TPA: 30S ribosomal protein S12 methylthiotransferase RimO [Phycisphaerales bacterium]|nr:30S ribosomal protein S12 methylthiotransferase RimO [Phycisphaerales bacterium]
MKTSRKKNAQAGGERAKARGGRVREAGARKKMKGAQAQGNDPAEVRGTMQSIDDRDGRPTEEGTSAKVAFVSLGCPKNLVDSEAMLGSLGEAGCELVGSDDEADAIVINTCGFLEASKEESLGVIREAVERKERGELKRVVVAGCLVQRHRAKLLEWAPGIDALLGVFDRDKVLDAVSGEDVADEMREGEACGDDSQGDGHAHDHSHAHDDDDGHSRGGGAVDLVKTLRARGRNGSGKSGGNGAVPGGAVPKYWIAGNALQAAKERGIATTGLTVNGKDGKGIGYFESDSVRLRLTPRHYAYLRVSEGCNQRCAFCTIPSIRGKMRSKPVEAVVEEARMLMRDGAVELNLIGQDTTSYGYDIGYEEGLIGLLTELNEAVRKHARGDTEKGWKKGRAWVRLMYVYPTHFTDEMIEAIAKLEHVVKYIDIPLQHISDGMLKSMRRNISKRTQEELIEKLRERIPGLAVRTTFITGYPGETEEDHAELVEFVKRAKFDAMGVFRYSHEEGTPAGTLEDEPEMRVKDEVKRVRERELMLAQQEIAFARAAVMAREQRVVEVLIDGEADGEMRKKIAGKSTKRVYMGRTYFQAPQVDAVTYVVSDEELEAGSLVECEVVGSEGYDVIARKR